MALVTMTPALLFMYGFVPLGVIGVLVAFGLALRKPQPIKPWAVMLLGGLLLGGTGGFGPAFLGDYADFIRSIASADPNSAAAKEGITKLAGDLAADRVPADAKALAEAVLKQSDVPDSEAVIDAAMQNATPAGKESLSSVKRALVRRAEGAVIEANPVRPPVAVPIDRLQPDALRALNTRSDPELRKLGIDPTTLRSAASRAGRNH